METVNYLYEFNISSEQNYENETEEQSISLDREIECFFEDGNTISENTDSGTLIMYLTKKKYNRFCEILDNYNVIYQNEDISKKVIYNSNIPEYYYNTDLITSYIEENKNIDDILDKINISGIESLSVIDKKILEKAI